MPHHPLWLRVFVGLFAGVASIPLGYLVWRYVDAERGMAYMLIGPFYFAWQTVKEIWIECNSGKPAPLDEL